MAKEVRGRGKREKSDEDEERHRGVGEGAGGKTLDSGEEVRRAKEVRDR